MITEYDNGTVQDLDDADLHIGTVGFETRSTYLIRRGLNALECAFFGFQRTRSDQYDVNKQVADLSGIAVEEVSDNLFIEHIRRLLHEVRPRKVAIDVSSMTRVRIAATTLALDAYGHDVNGVDVTWAYCPGIFSRPSQGLAEGLVAGPLPGFAGSLRRGSLPITAVLGLGYEPQRAIGAIEFLEPSRTWTYMPLSTPAYEVAVARANQDVLRLVDKNTQLEYAVDDPMTTLNSLESFTTAAGVHSRVVIVPMGPKIFAVCSLLVGLGDDGNRPAIWRVGVGAQGIGPDAVEDGRIIVLNTRLE